MKKNIFQLLLHFVILANCSFAQIVPEWTIKSGSGINMNMTDLVISSNNSFFASSFEDTITFGAEKLVSKGGNDILLASVNKNGSINQVKQIGDNLDNLPQKLATNDSVIILSAFNKHRIPMFSNFKGSFNSILIQSFNKDFTTVWSLSLNCTGNAGVDVLHLGSDKNLVVGGWFTDSLLIENTWYKSEYTTSAFILELSNQGKTINFSVIEGIGYQRVSAAVIDKSNYSYYVVSISGQSKTMVYDKMGSSNEFNHKGCVIICKGIDGIEWAMPIVASGFFEVVDMLFTGNNKLLLGVNFNSDIKFANEFLSTDKQLSTAFIELTTNGEVIGSYRFENYQYSRMLNFAEVNKDFTGIVGYCYSEDNINPDGKIKNEIRESFYSVINRKGEKQELYIIPEFNSYCRSLGFDDEGSIYITGAYTEKHFIKSILEESEFFNENCLFLTKLHICKKRGSLISGPDLICPGDTLLINSELGFQKYVWNGILSNLPSMEVLSAGKYFLNVSDFYGCNYSDSINIREKEKAKLFTLNDTILMQGQLLHINIDTMFSDFYWSDGFAGRSRTVSWVNKPDKIVLSAFGSAYNLCPVTEDLVVGFFNENYIDHKFKIYPNPCKEKFIWTFNDNINEEFNLEIVNQSGKVLYSNCFNPEFKEKENLTDIDFLEKGSYIVTISSSGTLFSTILIKQ